MINTCLLFVYNFWLILRIDFGEGIQLEKLNVAFKTLPDEPSIVFAASDPENPNKIVFATKTQFYSGDIEKGKVDLIIGNTKTGYAEGTGESALFYDIESFVQVQVNGESRLILTDTRNHKIRWVFRNNRSSARIIGSRRNCDSKTYNHAIICYPQGMALAKSDKVKNVIILYVSQPAYEQQLVKLVILGSNATLTRIRFTGGKRVFPLYLTFDLEHNALYMSGQFALYEFSNSTIRTLEVTRRNDRGYTSPQLWRKMTAIFYIGSGQMFIAGLTLFGTLDLTTSIYSPICSGSENLTTTCEAARAQSLVIKSANLVNDSELLLSGSMGFLTINCKWQCFMRLVE